MSFSSVQCSQEALGVYIHAILVSDPYNIQRAAQLLRCSTAQSTTCISLMKMEAAGVLSEINWSSFSGVESADEEEAAFISQLLDGYPFANAQDPDSNLVWPSSFLSGHEEMTAGIVDDTAHFSNMAMMMNSNMECWQQDNSSGLFCENYHLGDAKLALLTNDVPSSMDICVVGEQNISPSLQPVSENQSEFVFCLNEDVDMEYLGESGMNPSRAVSVSSQKLQPKRKLKAPELAEEKLDKDIARSSENPKKKSRVSGDEQWNGKKSQPKKTHKHASAANQEECIAALNGQNSSSHSSEEDDSNASQELNGAPSSSSKDSSTLNQSGKSRASWQTATDPQSLYARRRRERINERLRILQNLVPNGTKVDISTMLEEAVQYVKFLQLQVKLLSSDDLWMYAPLAYNGMDIARLNLKMSAPQ